MNAYFFKMNQEEKNNILDQHKQVYDGYVTRYNQESNQTPLYTQDFANDKEGITVNNKGEVKTYTNVGINESMLDTIGDGPTDLENGTVNLDVDDNHEMMHDVYPSPSEDEYISLGNFNNEMSQNLDQYEFDIDELEDYSTDELQENEQEVEENFLKRMFGKKEKEEVTPEQEKDSDTNSNSGFDRWDPADWDPHTMMHRSDMEAMDRERSKPKDETPKPQSTQNGEYDKEFERLNRDYGALAATLGIDPREVERLYPNETNEGDDHIKSLSFDELGEMDDDDIPNLMSSINESLDMFRRFKKYN
jgi:hypothetical protein